MPASIGVNLRVTGHCRQGGRKYMEDFFSVAYQQTEDEKDLEYAFFGIYDGHGGGEAATFAKEHLMEAITKQKSFWSERDEDVLKAIKEGYMNTHYAMWHEQDKWPKTASGLPSTAGTTASVAFIRRGKIYTGHVGDSAIVLGFQERPGCAWQARALTRDHKPENATEMTRIEQSGGKVVIKSGVSRVVWNRPRVGHKGPVRRSTPIDEIPFLAVARSLGDLWSYNSALDEFVVSPDPDVSVVPIDTGTFRCLVFGTDGLWNMLTPAAAIAIVQTAEQHNEKIVLSSTAPANGPSQTAASASSSSEPAPQPTMWINPSKSLVDHALERWSSTRMRADNTSVVTLMLDPPGPPRAQVIRQNLKSDVSAAPQPATTPTSTTSPPMTTTTATTTTTTSTTTTTTTTTDPRSSPSQPAPRPSSPSTDDEEIPANGLRIVTRYGSDQDDERPRHKSPAAQKKREHDPASDEENERQEDAVEHAEPPPAKLARSGRSLPADCGASPRNLRERNGVVHATRASNQQQQQQQQQHRKHVSTTSSVAAK